MQPELEKGLRPILCLFTKLNSNDLPRDEQFGIGMGNVVFLEQLGRNLQKHIAVGKTQYCKLGL